MLRRFVSWSVLPVILMHINAAVFEAVELELRLVFRVERRDAIVAGGTVEEHHIAQHALTCQHLAQKLLTEGRVDLRSSDRNVISAASNDDSWVLSKVSLSKVTLLDRPLKRVRRALVVDIRLWSVYCGLEPHAQLL